jgi:signal transduction histidine kinase
MTPRALLRRWFGSVRLRITLAAAGLVLIGLSAASFGLVRAVHANLLSEIRRTNNDELSMIARQLAAGRAPDQVNLPSDPGAGGPPSILVQGPDGQLFNLDQRRAYAGLRPAPPPADQSVRAQARVSTQQGVVTLIAQRSVGEVNRTVHSVTDALLLGVPALVAAIALLTWYLAGRALHPVEAIRAEAASITGTTIHRRVPEPDSGDEVGRLARTMNEMLDRLEDSSIRQRQFVSDASHELRSPVAAIRAQLEVALRRGDEADWPQVARRVLDEDDRLEGAVSELLELARVDEAAPEHVDVDFDDLVLEEAGRVRAVPIDTAHVSGGRVVGDRRQLQRLVRNLLDNASAHARGQVAASVITDDGSVWLVVDDDGPGIPAADRERVFDRFTRLDEGRERAGGGAGLGLAMVRSIAEGHGGAVAIADAPIGGARFVVRLPADGRASEPAS